ncbi:FAD:protein FMN transferase [Mucilaginibacter sp. JRF]|uniref:FAD:protein FMN transferase n=1 Tax=Mucilaginibacter sp. JRF TaxID=2780088 RepID=UPI001881311C|nr:FAD:protein FMN transferase [Mucilaginibacter sp. JRF]MBE9585305.1 FAD:protein FMN transferase [Mucilaginibacter sp. JRF]
MLAVKNLVSRSTIYRHSTMLMGTRFEITVVGENPGWATERINDAIAEINRVDKLLSTFGDESSINQINGNAGIAPVKVSGELFRLIDRSLQVAELTYGTFDITYSTAPKTVAGVSYKDVVLDANTQTVFLTHEGMRISFAANGKGYAADRAKFVLQMNGVSSGVINAGGDMVGWGTQPDSEPWTVAAADPEQADKPYAQLNISNLALATSVNVDAENIKKNITAITSKGFEVSAIKSVTIVSPTAEMADAMASPVISIGVNAGMYLINRLNQIACVIVDDHDRVYTSKGITL